MEKETLLNLIAETAYNVGFGAKKHLATYDIVSKIPGLINFVSISIGILALVTTLVSGKLISAYLLIFGVISLYISYYNDSIDEYAKKGANLTDTFNELKNLYFEVKDSTDNDGRASEDMIARHQELQRRGNSTSQSKQIFFSDWYAHYKFFWQHQIDWVNEQKNFRLFRDKIPLSLTVTVIVTISSTAIVTFIKYNSTLSRICEAYG